MIWDRLKRCIKYLKKSTSYDITFLNFSTFQHFFYSPQLKSYLISSIANIVYEQPHELATNQDLGSHEIRKCQEQNWVGYRAWCLVFLSKIRLLYQQSKITQRQLSKFEVPVQFCFTLISLLCSKYFVHDSSFIEH